MHILFLTDNFPPEGNAPASRTFEHARVWVELGNKVTVITCAPNFPEGKVFEGYSNDWINRETMEGIDVVRVKTYITANEGFVKRILDFMSFMVTGFCAGLFVKKPDIVVATSPQFFTAVSGWAVSAFKRKPFVFELRDVWPASITAVGAMKKSLVIRLLEKLEMFLYRCADKIIAVGDGYKNEIIERGVPADKISVVLNGVDSNIYKPQSQKAKDYAEQYGLTGKFVVGYVGTHGMAHALDKVLDAAELLKGNDSIRILLAGGGAAKPALEARIARENLNNVICIPRQPKERMPDLWSLCDLSLVSLKDTDLFATVIPSKIFESMGMGLPIIISAPDGESTKIVVQNESGLAIPPENPKELAKAISHLAKDDELIAQLADKALTAATRYSRKKLALDMLNELALVIQEAKK